MRRRPRGGRGVGHRGGTAWARRHRPACPSRVTVARSAAIALTSAVLLTLALVPPASAGSPVAPSTNPLVMANYLGRQRAGFGHPYHGLAASRQVALLTNRAAARAQALPVRQAGVANTLLRVNGARSSAALGTVWKPLGPAPVTESTQTSATGAGGDNSGRVDGVAIAQRAGHDVVKGEIFVATAGGGIWSSRNGGKTWVTHTDHVATGLAVGAITLDPSNPDIVYAGTGEANNCTDCFYGAGVLKSTNGGTTWTVENPGRVFSGVDFSAIRVDPRNHLHLFAATTKGFFDSDGDGLVHD